MKTPERIWVHESDFDDREFIVYEEDPGDHTSTEYIRASLLKSQLKDDKWLAENGLMKMASGCHVDGLKGIHTYDDCVIDSGDYEQCRYAHMGIAKEDCK